jgi:predicted protein tyrosine phosphatase
MAAKGLNPLRFLRKGWVILSRRIREQGVATTLKWAYARGYTKLTGVPTLAFSRVTDHLYVGAQYNAAGRRLLDKHGIAHVINMRAEFDSAEHDLAPANYCYLPTIDDAAPSVEHLLTGAAFIHAAVNANARVYVHCAGGVGRAPTMAAAYLITTGKSLDDALAMIRRVRPFITVMPSQMAALRDFERDYRAGTLTLPDSTAAVRRS